jgi:hypothetical protein
VRDVVAITAALRGAGGYGKTMLAKALAKPWPMMLRHKQRLCRFDMYGAKPTIAVARFRQTLSHGTECPWISYSAISPFSESTSNGGCRFSGV